MDENILLEERSELVTEHTPHETSGLYHTCQYRLSPAVAHVLGFCKANENI